MLSKSPMRFILGDSQQLVLYEHVDYALHSLLFREGCFAEFRLSMKYKNNQFLQIVVEARNAYLKALEAFACLYYPARMSDINAARMIANGSIVRLFESKIINKGWVLEHYLNLQDEAGGPRSIVTLLKSCFPDLLTFTEEIFKTIMGDHIHLKRRIGAIAWWCVDNDYLNEAVLLKAAMDGSVLLKSDFLAGMKTSIFAWAGSKSLLNYNLDDEGELPLGNWIFYCKDLLQLAKSNKRFLSLYPFLLYTEQIEFMVSRQIVPSSNKFIERKLGLLTGHRFLKIAQLLFDKFHIGKGDQNHNDVNGMYKFRTFCLANPGRFNTICGMIMSVIDSDEKFKLFLDNCPGTCLIAFLREFNGFIDEKRLVQIALEAISVVRITDPNLIADIVDNVARIFAIQVMGRAVDVKTFMSTYFFALPFKVKSLSFHHWILQRGPVKLEDDGSNTVLIFVDNIPYFLPEHFINKDLYWLFCRDNPRAVLHLDGKPLPYSDTSIVDIAYANLTIVKY